MSDTSPRRLADLAAQTPVPEGRIALDLQIGSIDAPCATPEVVEFADAIVTPFGFVVAGDRLIFNTQILPNGWMRGAPGGAPDLVQKIFGHNFIHKLDAGRGTCTLSVPAEMTEIAEPAFLFNSRLTCFNFAHLVHDTLIQTPTYLDAGAALPLLVGPGFSRHVSAELFRLALGPEAPAPLFLRNAFYKVRRLLVPTTHFSPARNEIARGAVARLQENLAAALSAYREPRPRRLFISREDSGRGDDREPRFSNAGELADALTALGFETVIASRLGVEDYLRTFVNAEIVVGLHGAGLLNLLLSRRPRVLEITVPGYPDWRSLRLFMETGMAAPYRRAVMAAPVDGAAAYDIPAIVADVGALLAVR